MDEITDFVEAEFLTSPEAQAEYLKLALENDTPGRRGSDVLRRREHHQSNGF